ncbi:MAG TPA: hypothetical protein VK524_05690, partial [Polyangiaceae bacterium]|nr:hypothetical protein [Polyangiaceae bacterium]
MTCRWLTSCLMALAIAGCGKVDDSVPAGPEDPQNPQNPADPGEPFDPTDPLPEEEIAPQDMRPVVKAAKPPPPISGGTLLITRDGQHAVAADPDRDRISIVSLKERKVLHTIALQEGDEPGRVVEDAAGRVHAALRRAGAVVSVNLEKGTILGRRNVCGAPRGIAYDAATNQLHVACAGGQLVSLSAEQGPVLRRIELGPGLRDVVVRKGNLLVSRFKAADAMKIGPDGTVLSRAIAAQIQRESDPSAGAMVPESTTGGVNTEPLDPDGAWRMLARGSEEALLLHQYALAAPIEVNRRRDKDEPRPEPGGQQPYGAPPGGCGGLVQPGMSSVGADGSLQMGLPIAIPVMAVDAALAPDNRWIAVAHAGPPDPTAPVFVPMPSAPSLGTVTFVDGDDLLAHRDRPNPCKRAAFTLSVAGQATAVAFNPTVSSEAAMFGTWVVVQTREPAKLVFLHD